MKLNKIYLCLIFSLLFCAAAYGKEAAERLKLIVFYSPTCHNCTDIKAKVMPKIEKEFSGRIDIEYRDISDVNNYKQMLAIDEQQGKKIELTLPVFYFSGRLLNGKGDTESALRLLLVSSLAQARKEISLPVIDLIARFRDFRLAGVLSAGLVDGINPCAFTVIVFFMSFLVLQGYRKRELAVIGLAFILAVFATYLLLGVGIFNFFYQLKSFWIAAKIANLGIGIFSLGLGVLAATDFFKYASGGRPEGQFLQLPQSVKNRIHYIIGLHYRKNKDEGAPEKNTRIFKLFISSLVTGFLVSILEAVCTGQVYLPTITFVLKSSPLKLEAFGFLLLYNLMFILPLCVVFLCALFGATSEQFAKFTRKNLGLAKALLALMFFGLGILLIWRA
ncbi:MAG: hypothetical protein Q8N85_00075 [Candidatus Omnitrophota bacterium]|nr:hypothetical protein [Candidatus Omnitrophota bacterium]